MVDKVNEILLEDSENVERRMKCRLALNNFDCYKELLSEIKHKTKQSNLKVFKCAPFACLLVNKSSFCQKVDFLI